MPLLLRWMGILTIALLSLMAAGVQAGASLRSMPTQVADLDACGLPCWRAIVPREMRVPQAEQRLREIGYTFRARDVHYNYSAFLPASSSECSVLIGNSRGEVATISLTGCGDVRIGDVMAILGIPDGMVGWNTISFRDSKVFVTVAGDVCRESLSPFSLIGGIFIVGEDRSGRGLFVRQFAPETTQLYDWLGFIPRTHHYLRAPELQVCR